MESRVQQCEQAKELAEMEGMDETAVWLKFYHNII